MHPITKLPQLEALQSNTMIYAAIVAIVALVVAWLVANAIPFEGGQDRSYVKRRIAFIAIGIVAVAGFFLYNDLYVLDSIRGKALQSKFMTTNFICVGINAGVYFILGVIIMVVSKFSKFGSILNRK